MRDKENTVNRGFCKSCESYICIWSGSDRIRGHRPDCENKDTLTHYMAMEYAQRQEFQARKTWRRLLIELNSHQGKMAILKAENNKLRKQVEKLKEEKREIAGMEKQQKPIL